MAPAPQEGAMGVAARRRLACGVAVGALLAACAVGDGDSDGDPGGPDPASTRTRRPDETPSPPPFEATIEDPDAGDGRGRRDGGPDPDPPSDAGPCVDSDDPGGAENVAKALPDTDDCDDAYKTVSGVANGAVDVDYYELSVADRACGLLQPDLESLTPGAELCVFVRCKSPTAGALTGCEQGTPATSSGGLEGCCANGGKAVPRWNCSGLDDSADLYLRVRQPSGGACLKYELRYRF